MIKRSPQEIADFFRCYVSQNFSGDWFVHMDKPVMYKGAWISHDGIGFLNQLVEATADHDWVILYEPRPYSEKPADSINKEASCSEKAPVSENKPDHTSEIYTEKEFKLIPAFDPARLEAMISDYLNEGFTLYGNPFVVEDRKYGPMIIQAMVRGI